jgi:hypothetical protein
MKTPQRFCIALLLTTAPLVGPACAIDQPCDPGSSLNADGLCAPTSSSSTGGSGGGDAGVAADGGDGGDGGDGAPTCANPSKPGDPCTGDASCPCGADLCVILPGATAGYCTNTACNVDPAVCPAGWTCFDASQFQPGVPWLCLKP